MTYYFSRDVIWLRLWGRGFSLKRTPMLFSERNGYTKYRRLPFGWRLIFLGKQT